MTPFCGAEMAHKFNLSDFSQAPHETTYWCQWPAGFHIVFLLCSHFSFQRKVSQLFPTAFFSPPTRPSLLKSKVRECAGNTHSVESVVGCH